MSSQPQQEQEQRQSVHRNRYDYDFEEMQDSLHKALLTLFSALPVETWTIKSGCTHTNTTTTSTSTDNDDDSKNNGRDQKVVSSSYDDDQYDDRKPAAKRTIPKKSSSTTTTKTSTTATTATTTTTITTSNSNSSTSTTSSCWLLLNLPESCMSEIASFLLPYEIENFSYKTCPSLQKHTTTIIYPILVRAVFQYFQILQQQADIIVEATQQQQQQQQQQHENYHPNDDDYDDDDDDYDDYDVWKDMIQCLTTACRRLECSYHPYPVPILHRALVAEKILASMTLPYQDFPASFHRVHSAYTYYPNFHRNYTHSQKQKQKQNNKNNNNKNRNNNNNNNKNKHPPLLEYCFGNCQQWHFYPPFVLLENQDHDENDESFNNNQNTNQKKKNQQQQQQQTAPYYKKKKKKNDNLRLVPFLQAADNCGGWNYDILLQLPSSSLSCKRETDNNNTTTEDDDDDTEIRFYTFSSACSDRPVILPSNDFNGNNNNYHQRNNNHNNNNNNTTTTLTTTTTTSWPSLAAFFCLDTYKNRVYVQGPVTDWQLHSVAWLMAHHIPPFDGSQQEYIEMIPWDSIVENLQTLDDPNGVAGVAGAADNNNNDTNHVNHNNHNIPEDYTSRVYSETIDFFNMAWAGEYKLADPNKYMDAVQTTTAKHATSRKRKNGQR